MPIIYKRNCNQCGKFYIGKGYKFCSLDCFHNNKEHAIKMCNIRKGKYTGKQNFNYKDGRTLKKYYCLDCGKEVWFRTKRCISCNTKYLIKIGKIEIKKGKNHYNWKGGWRNKLPKCIDCGIQLSNQYAKRCKKCWSRSDGNSFWQGGISLNPYGVLFGQQLKDKVRVRDNFICQVCRIPELEMKTRLCVHHIDYNKNNNDMKNLISLCNICHAKTNFNRNYWIKYFNNNKEGKMGKVIAAAVMVAIMLVGGLAMAGGSYPIVEKTIKGDNDSCPMLFETGIAHVWNKEAKVELKTTLSYTNSIDSFTKNNSVKVSNIATF